MVRAGNQASWLPAPAWHCLLLDLRLPPLLELYPSWQGDISPGRLGKMGELPALWPGSVRVHLQLGVEL